MFKGIPGGRAAVRKQVAARDRTHRVIATKARRKRLLARIHFGAVNLADLMAARRERREVLA